MTFTTPVLLLIAAILLVVTWNKHESFASASCPPFKYPKKTMFTYRNASDRDSKRQYIIHGGNIRSNLCRGNIPVGNVKHNLNLMLEYDVSSKMKKNLVPQTRAWSTLKTIDDFNRLDLDNVGIRGALHGRSCPYSLGNARKLPMNLLKDSKVEIHPLFNPIATCLKDPKNPSKLKDCIVRTPFQVTRWSVHRDRARNTLHETGYADRFTPGDSCIHGKGSPTTVKERQLYFWRLTRSTNKFLDVLLSYRSKSKEQRTTSRGLKIFEIDLYVAENIDRAWNHKIAELDPNDKAAGIAGGAYVKVKYVPQQQNIRGVMHTIMHELAHVGAGGHGTPLFEYMQYKFDKLAEEFAYDGLLDGYFKRSGEMDMSVVPKTMTPSQEGHPCGYRASHMTSSATQGYFCW